MLEEGAQTEPQPWSADGSQIVLVLVGLIASGKSTFAKALEAQLPHFRRCNQDELGSRQAVERIVRNTLRQGLSVCIDRSNFDNAQRAHWINISKEITGTKVWCLVFDTPLNVCRDRLQYRTDHPTIRSPDEGLQVLYRFSNMFRPPTQAEGFDRIFYLKPQDHPSLIYTKDDLQMILAQIETSPLPTIAQPGIRAFFGGRPQRGGLRGRGRPGGPHFGRGYSQHWQHSPYRSPRESTQETRASAFGTRRGTDATSWRSRSSPGGVLESRKEDRAVIDTPGQSPSTLDAEDAASPKGNENGTANFPFKID